eukprot:TRINITY_DN5850_c0_g1_i4.p2 TRINITY_DN5850_c0_g1~~TRINITY_DN5850_c0_g1_i4.p2  ORF type:complete len:118 (-),score=5.94 TRINITY_DN5850_c0_g1_i4:43-396(-)
MRWDTASCNPAVIETLPDSGRPAETAVAPWRANPPAPVGFLTQRAMLRTVLARGQVGGTTVERNIKHCRKAYKPGVSIARTAGLQLAVSHRVLEVPVHRRYQHFCCFCAYVSLSTTH